VITISSFEKQEKNREFQAFMLKEYGIDLESKKNILDKKASAGDISPQLQLKTEVKTRKRWLDFTIR